MSYVFALCGDQSLIYCLQCLNCTGSTGLNKVNVCQTCQVVVIFCPSNVMMKFLTAYETRLHVTAMNSVE